MLKRIYSITILVIFLLLLLRLIVQATRNNIMPIGCILPDMEYSAPYGPAKIRSSGKPLIIVYFSTTCEHCRYQLTVFDRHIEKFKDIDIFFFTSERDFFLTHSGIEWENLEQAQNVLFGVVSKNTFSEVFGTTTTPSLFFFNNLGKLKEKIRGEIKVAMILKIIQSSGRTQSAATNNVP